MKAKNFGALVALFIFLGCDKEKKNLETGAWRAQLTTMDAQVLPFNFELKKDGEHYSLDVYNAEEIIEVDSVRVTADSIIIRMPVFEGYLAGTYTNQTMEGKFIKESLDRIVPFKAEHGNKNRFMVSRDPATDVSGIWEVEFTDEDQTYPAKGIFKQAGARVTGTFRTTTGDYRYLEGVVEGDSVKLSAFDGAHAFLFQALVKGDSLTGAFYSGNHHKETFIAGRNPEYELPDANDLTFLKEGYESLEFSFPDHTGNQISLVDDRFADKVVLVQIMGTWCPNCLDESRFLAEYLEENNHEDLEIVALAFEYAKTPEAAFRGIERLKKRLNLTYPILLAQHGTSNKLKANEKLPMLNHILSYPTTIFIDKTGKVRKIHTGFNGPATGENYEEFQRDFKETINSLLAE